MSKSKCFTKKAISVFLSVLLILSCMSAMFTALAANPARHGTESDIARNTADIYNVTDAGLGNIISSLDRIIAGNDFADLAGLGGSVQSIIMEAVGGGLYNDDVINDVIEALYPDVVDELDAGLKKVKDDYGSYISDTLEDMCQKLMSQLNLYVYPQDLAIKVTNAYPAVYNELRAAKYDWDKVNFENLIWGVTNREEFVAALCAAVSGFGAAFRALLTNYNFNETETVLGAGDAGVKLTLRANAKRGYMNSIYPLLKCILGEASATVKYKDVYGVEFTGLRTVAQYEAFVSERDLIAHFITPLLVYIEDVLPAKPAESALGIISRLAYHLQNGDLTNWIKSLRLDVNIDFFVYIKVIWEIVNKSVYNKDFALDVAKMLRKRLPMTSLQNINTFVAQFLGDSPDFPMPVLDGAALGSYYNPAANTVNRPQLLLYILRFLLNTLRTDTALNNYLIEKLGDKQEIIDIINNVTAENNVDNVIASLCELFNPVEYTMANIQWKQVGTTVKSTVIENMLQYDNNWTQSLAGYFVNDALSFVNSFLFKDGFELKGSTYYDVNEMLRGACASYIFTHENAVKILEALQGLTEKLLTAEGEAEKETDVIPLVKRLLDVDLSVWQPMSVPVFADGDSTAFIDAVSNILAPLAPVLSFLLTGSDLKLLSDKDNEKILTIFGGDGYSYAVVPLLEALGCDSAYILSDTQYKTSAMENGANLIKNILNPIAKFIEDDLVNDPLGKLLDILPNLLYFISSGGISVSVRNLIHPLFVLLDTARPIYNVDIDALIMDAAGDILGDNFSIFALDEAIIIKLIEDYTGLHADKYLGTLIRELPKGRLVSSMSANKLTTKYDIDIATEDVLTLILSTAILLLTDDDNYLVACDLVGKDVIDTLRALNNPALSEIKKINWIGTDYADKPSVERVEFYDEITGKTRIENVYNSITHVTYGNKWTREKAEYTVNNLDLLADNMINLLGVKIDGKKLSSLDAIVANYLNIYTQENVTKLLLMIQELVASLDSEIIDIVNEFFDIDLAYWNQFSPYHDWGFKDGSRPGFAQAISELLLPAAPLLEALLLGVDIEYLNSHEGESLIKLGGASGYKYGVIPLMEALGCKGIKTAEQFKNDVEEDRRAIIYDILFPIFDVIDSLLVNPADEVLNILTGIIYFINSDGLNSSLQNLLGAAYSITEAIYPLTGFKISDSFDLNEITVESLYLDLIADVEESTGFSFMPILGNAINDLSVGRIVSYQSLNGLTAYRMEYTEVDNKADMITVLLRLLIKFITYDENIYTLQTMLEESTGLKKDEFILIYAFLETLLVYSHSPMGTEDIMSIIFDVFKAAVVATTDVSDKYTELNNNFAFLYYMLVNSKIPEISAFGKVFMEFIDRDLKDIFDSAGVMSGGFISFIERIMEFFQKIIDFFKNLFDKT